MMLLGTLLFAGCAPTAYQQGLPAGERLSQMTQQNAQLERRVIDLEQQLARRQASVAPSAAEPPPHAQTWRQRLNAIPYGTTYAAVIQVVGQPTHMERERNVAYCVYYVSEQEIYLLVFESEVYTEGYVDTRENWMKAASRRS
jgi:hypothetical protein